MEPDFGAKRAKPFVEPIKWCQYIVRSGYTLVALIVLTHVVWYFAAQEALVNPPDVYLRDYIILPTIGLLALNAGADFLIRSRRIPLVVKEYLSLSLYVAFAFYLCLTHKITTVLLGAFVVPVFASTIFSNIKLTRRVFWMSGLALLLCGAKAYVEKRFGSRMLMELIVAGGMLVGSNLLAKALTRYNYADRMSLMRLYHQQQSLQEQLKLDPYTGLQNKATFDECLPALVEACRNAKMHLSLAMIDVDYFKRINDFHGHAAGDRALLHMARILKSAANDNVTAFRLGGDEFAVLFKDYCAKDARKICEGMRAILESSSVHEGSKKIKVTFSCGLVCLRPQHASAADLSKAADAALYEAKNSGRNNVAIAQCAEEAERRHEC